MQRAESAPAAFAPALPGFGVLFEKEVLESRRSKRLIAFLIIMTLAVLLVPIIGYFQVESLNDGARIRTDKDGMDAMLGSWAALTGYLASLMVIAATVDAVTRERALGITAWIATKPVSRLSYLLAKACAETAVSAATVVVIPTVVWLVLTMVLFSGVPVANVIVATGLLVIEVGFLAFLIVGLGVIFRSVAPIAIIALAVWFIPNIVPAISTLEWTVYVIPSYLPVAATFTAIDEVDAHTWSIPLSAIAIAMGGFALAAYQFEQQEL